MTTAAIRYKNPGAQWGGPISRKWGAINDIVLNDGQKNHIAVFPTYVQGAAAQFDLWRSHYTPMTLAAATQRWSGGNSDENYVEWLCTQTGIKPTTMITAEFLASATGLKMMKAQAHWEAGQVYPMTDAEWKQAQDMVFKGKVGPKAINVRRVRAVFDPEVEAAQNQLKAFGYYEVGEVDGLWGGRTVGALNAFLTDGGYRSTVTAADGGIKPEVRLALADASNKHFTRPVSIKRASASADDLAPVNVAVRQSLFQRLGAQITGWVATAGATIGGVAQAFPAVKAQVQPVQEFFTDVPGWVWFAGIASVALVVFMSANRVKNATVEDYNRGKIN